MTDFKNLKKNENNPRKITEESRQRLKMSLDKFGDLDGILYNTTSKRLVGGHQRVSVMPENSVIEITKKYDTPTKTGTVAEGFVIVKGEKFKYREVAWNSEEETAAMIAANSHAGEWNHDLLDKAMGDLKNSPLMGLLPIASTMGDFSLGSKDIGAQKSTLPTNPVSSNDEKEESDEEYVKNTPQTTEQIPVERPNLNVESKGFDEVQEKTEIAGKRYVIIIDCPNQEIKDQLKADFLPRITEAGAKVF